MEEFDLFGGQFGKVRVYELDLFGLRLVVVAVLFGARPFEQKHEQIIRVLADSTDLAAMLKDRLEHTFDSAAVGLVFEPADRYLAAFAEFGSVFKVGMKPFPMAPVVDLGDFRRAADIAEFFIGVKKRLLFGDTLNRALLAPNDVKIGAGEAFCFHRESSTLVRISAIPYSIPRRPGRGQQG